jgi:ubiquinone/menaquinone biosynthesis C-methylase UbiE
MPGKVSDAVWGPFFARFYDRMTARTEGAGLRDKRRTLLGRASGRTLELGAGTGANLELYPDTVTELVLTEPDEHMRAQLERKLSEAGRTAEVVAADSQHLPFPDDSFDTVVGTLVFCTIDDPAAALREARRVLKPDGRLLFIEHVRAQDEKLARWQDRLERPWGWMGRGCHPNRDTLATIRAAGLDVVEVDNDVIPKAPPLVRPLIVGEARPTA